MDGRRLHTASCGIRTQWPTGRRIPLYFITRDEKVKFKIYLFIKTSFLSILICRKNNIYCISYYMYMIHIHVNHTWPTKVIRFLLPHLILFGWNLSWDFEIINSHTVGCQRLTHFSSFVSALLWCSGFQPGSSRLAYRQSLNRFLNPWPVPFIVEFVESQFWMWEYG